MMGAPAEVPLAAEGTAPQDRAAAEASQPDVSCRARRSGAPPPAPSREGRGRSYTGVNRRLFWLLPLVLLPVPLLLIPISSTC